MAARRTRTALGSMTQDGFTVLELLVAMTVAVVVVATASGALLVTMRSVQSSSTGIRSSNGAFQTGTRFADDVSSVGPVLGVAAPVASMVTGCGGTEAQLRLVGPGVGGAVLVRSYHRVGSGEDAELERRECSGADLASALTSTPTTTTTVVRSVGTGAGDLTVACDGGAVTWPCRVVTMEVRPQSGHPFEVRGSVAAAAVPTATTAPQPVRAPATGTCTIYASATTWGATGGYAGPSGDTHNGDPVMYTYNDTNRRNSFLRFDLTQPCAGAGEPWPTLPGARTVTGVTLYLAYLGKTNSYCGIFPGISYDGQRMEPLNDAATWNEATLNGSNMPGGVRGGNNYDFNVANAGSATAHVNSAITNAVSSWYQAGGWVNNGWRLSRSSAGDTCGDSNRFASRFDGNQALRPRLVITWGP